MIPINFKKYKGEPMSEQKICPMKAVGTERHCDAGACQMWLGMVDKDGNMDESKGTCSISLQGQALNGIAQMLSILINMQRKPTPGQGLYVPGMVN